MDHIIATLHGMHHQALISQAQRGRPPSARANCVSWLQGDGAHHWGGRAAERRCPSPGVQPPVRAQLAAAVQDLPLVRPDSSPTSRCDSARRVLVLPGFCRLCLMRCDNAYSVLAPPGHCRQCLDIASDRQAACRKFNATFWRNPEYNSTVGARRCLIRLWLPAPHLVAGDVISTFLRDDADGSSPAG